MIYGEYDPLCIMAKVFNDESDFKELMSSDYTVIGIAYSNHNAANHCLVIILCDKIKEDPNKIDYFCREPYI